MEFPLRNPSRWTLRRQAIAAVNNLIEGRVGNGEQNLQGNDPAHIEESESSVSSTSSSSYMTVESNEHEQVQHNLGKVKVLMRCFINRLI